MKLRVLVTGSRRYDPQAVVRDLRVLLEDDSVKILTVVHGACASMGELVGADRGAHEFCRQWQALGVFLGKDVIEEQHDAAWVTHGRAAGPIRNQEMVNLGADLCLAYPLADSRGTKDCMAKAERAGIPVWDRTSVT